MKKFYNYILATSTIEIDTAALVAFILVAIGAASYIAVLEYRFRRLENHPFLRGLRRLQEEQMVDLARTLLRRGEDNDR